ncbi:MAG: DUF559 domain-containing protein [Bacillota bacterium]
MSYENSEISKERSRRLRNKQTREEKFLWYNYLAKCGQKFRRQYVVDPYIVDFYCIKLGLAIELDGGHHFIDEKQILHDKRRTEYLESKGIEVLRFDNLFLMDGFETVVKMIEDKIKEIQERG